MALILVICLVCPYVETALGWDGNIFMTGQDSETTVVVVILLLELVVALTGILSLFRPDIGVSVDLAKESSPLAYRSDFRLTSPDTSPPVALRI
jgi:hypothetical protein